MVGPGSCASGAAVCIAADHALAFVDGLLAPGARAEVEHRIDACPACRAIVAEAARSVEASRASRALQTSNEHPRGRPAGRAREPASEPPRPGGGELMPGEIVGRYVVERPIGAGGMGVVCLARDPELRRPVVIKLVHPNMGHGEGGDELEARLRREAQAMAQVSHTNVVQIFDIGRRGDRVFLAMELVAGHTLDGWLRARPRTADEILGVIRQAGAGLAAAHRAGLIHRDLKPSNVLVSHDGVAKVTDFGLARGLAAGLAPGFAGDAGATRKLWAAAVPAPRPSGVHAVLTHVGSVVGTPAYMAPEQAAGLPLDARSDQYALAVTLLDALLGQRPTERHVVPSDPPVDLERALRAAQIAAPVRAAIIRALEIEPDARFASLDDFLAALAGPVAPAGGPVAPAGGPVARAPVAAARGGRRGAVVGVLGVAVIGAVVAIAVVTRSAPAPVCTASAAARWTGAPRARVIAALAASPRPFAGWDAERIAAAIDHAVESLGAAQLAQCTTGAARVLGVDRAPRAGAAGSADPTGSADCIAHRDAALTAAITALSAPVPPDDAWRLVRAIDACDPAAGARAAELRRGLGGATRAQATTIAGAAVVAGDDALAADAFELAAHAALADADFAATEAALFAMKQAGERAGSDGPRGRALLHLVELARATGKYADARRALDELDAMLARHARSPREALVIALAAGDALTDLGDVAGAFAAWGQARDIALQLADADAALDAAARRAWSTQVLRFDPDGARAELTTALAGATAARPIARAFALGIAADLAIIARDAAAAQAALAEAHRLVPQRAGVLTDRLRTERARALAGEAERALAALAPAASDDPLTAARLQIAAGKILLAAGRAGEAFAVLDRVSEDVRGYSRRHVVLAVPERLDLELAVCETAFVRDQPCASSYRLDSLVSAMHPRAPIKARLAQIEAISEPLRSLPSMRSQALSLAADLLVEAHAAALPIAELRWQVAALGAFRVDHDHRALALAALPVLAAAGHTDEVAAIDRWLADHPPAPDDAPAPPATAP